MDFNHISVLLNETIESLNITKDGTYIDATMGGAGHSIAILNSLKEGMLICIDQDKDAIIAGKSRLYGFKNVSFVHDNFSKIDQIIKNFNIDYVNGIIMDLGVSSYQLDNKARGFSYMHDAPLDMRMDTRNSISAFDIINHYPEDKLAKIMLEYGEERYAKRIASLICKERKVAPISTTLALANIIQKAIPKSTITKGSHPAKRAFQAIRIEVNSELLILKDTIHKMVDILHTNGRLCIITFHSLEDRIVKNTFKQLANPCTCPVQFPYCICGKKPVGKIITKKPIVPSQDEIKANSRARSGKLRVFEKI